MHGIVNCIECGPMQTRKGMHDKHNTQPHSLTYLSACSVAPTEIQ